MLIKSNARRIIEEMKKSKKILFFLILYCLQPAATMAQCAMCRASLESTGDTVQAEAVNDGIVYLMIIPYVLVGLVAYAIFKMYQKKKSQ